MIIEADRLKEFKPRSRRDGGKADERRAIEAAHDAGIAMRMMREARDMRIGTLAELIGVSQEDLERAEKGQLVERAEDGRLIDCPAGLLVLIARATKHDSIPLPSK